MSSKSKTKGVSENLDDPNIAPVLDDNETSEPGNSREALDQQIYLDHHFSDIQRFSKFLNIENKKYPDRNMPLKLRKKIFSDFSSKYNTTIDLLIGVSISDDKLQKFNTGKDENILNAYPILTSEDIKAALDFSAQLLDRSSYIDVEIA